MQYCALGGVFVVAAACICVCPLSTLSLGCFGFIGITFTSLVGFTVLGVKFAPHLDGLLYVVWVLGIFGNEMEMCMGGRFAHFLTEAEKVASRWYCSFVIILEFVQMIKQCLICNILVLLLLFY